ncbi:PAS domain-containing protein, partial [Inquilinus limosus]|uniref:PAS domain-containing protein n=1 Tax=Inquilinus limosus TaxID=171674 RepID=UPI001872290E
MNWQSRYDAVAEAVAALLGPEAEVVLHELATDTILRIVNPLSRRRPGDPSLL